MRVSAEILCKLYLVRAPCIDIEYSIEVVGSSR